MLDWWAAPAETTEAYEQLFTRRWQRGRERIERLVSDGAEAITSAAAVVSPSAAHPLGLAHWFRNREALRPPWPGAQRRRFRRDFWPLWDALDQGELHRWAQRFCARWHAPDMVKKFRDELHRVLAYWRWPARWRHRLRTSNLAEGFFRHLRKYLNRFPGCGDAAHAEQILGCFLLAAEAMHS